MKTRLMRSLAAIAPLRFFVVVAAVFGLFFLIITPPFQGADEIVHFYRSYQVSEGHFVSTRQGDKLGGTLPISLGKIVAESNSSVIKFYPQNKYDEHRTKAALRIPNQQNEEKFYDFAASTPYSPAPYIGSATGIFAARILRLPNELAFYAGRFGDLVAWIALVGLAIQLIPRRKWALAFVGLLPMALFQAATLNSDAVTIGSLILFTATILHHREKARVDLRGAIALFLAASLMVLSKNVMFLFLPLIFLLKKDFFVIPKLNGRLVRMLLIVVPFILFALWMYTVRDFNSTTAYENHQDPARQISLILHSPHSYINTLWNTYFYTWGDGVTRSFIGTFGWSDTPLSEILVTFGYITLFLLLAANADAAAQKWFTKREKTWLWLLAAAYWLAANTALYVYYSPVGFKIIYGVQGRYFLPLALLGVLLLPTTKLKLDPVWYRRLAISAPIILLLSSTLTIYVRYFIHNV